MSKKSFSCFWVAGFVASSLIGSAIADMVYDDENSMSVAPTKIEVRNAIQAAAVEAPSSPPVIVESQVIQKESEKSRSKRGFQENVNNELVIQKLEERRLKQEEKLTSEINKRFTIEEDSSVGSAAPILKQESIVRPITDAPGSASMEMSNAPKAETPTAKPISRDEIVSYQSSSSLSPAPVGMSLAPAEGKPEGEKAFKNSVSIIPKAGLSTISSAGKDISPKFMTGVGVGVDVSEHVAVELGYAYSENGIRLDSTNPGAYYGYQPTNELTFKNNTFDAALKLYASSTESKVRPYIGVGGAYSIGYINYDRQQQPMYGYYYGGANNSTDYTLKQFQGMAELGLDIKLASNLSLGAAFKFYKPLSTSESEDGLQYGYFYGQPLTQIDPQKQGLRGTIRDSNASVFQISANIAF